MKIFAGLFSIFLLFSIPSYSTVLYKLDISLNGNLSELTGAATIKADHPEEVTVFTDGLEVKSVFYGKRKLSPNKKKYTVKVSQSEELIIIFKSKFKGYHNENLITEDAVSLLSGWYPSINKLAVYTLRVEADGNYIFVSESEEEEKLVIGEKTVYKFNFPYPIEYLHLIGAKNFKVKEKIYKGIKIQAYFFDRDFDLADEYIQKTIHYIEKYSKRIGKFPYKRFAIVENFFPTGYSMPTFTLIGQQIIRFPFIIEKSLPHEILHQWFGCSVFVNDNLGNWAEGLTTFLSDYYVSKNKSQYRKNVLLKYIAYSGNDYPLNAFRGKSDPQSEAIGYGKSMMVFYMLEDIIGNKKFNKFLKLFYQNFKFRKASWEDIRTVINQIESKDYKWFFDQWINTVGIPHLKINVKDHYLKDDGFHILIEVEQKHPFKIKLPIFVKTYLGLESYSVWIEKQKQEIDIVVSDEPLEIIIDKDYQVLRNLSWEEINPVIYFTLAGKNSVVYSMANDVYSPISSYYSEGSIKNPDQFSYSDLYNKNVVVLGADNPVVEKIFGKGFNSNKDFVEVFKNPFGDKNVITVFNLSNKTQARMVIGRIKHYGKYSRIDFEGFTITNKIIKNFQNGIILPVRQKAEIVAADGIKNFSDIIQDALNHRIIYIGEQHTMFSNHAMQLNIIKAIHRQYPDLAVGMEMFQRSKQEILDEFIKGEISEKEFLKKSGYYEAWKYNYHLYRPIILYCRENKIPIIALNADREIVRKVSDNGLESLSRKEIERLPAEMDFVNIKYIKYLKEIFAEHRTAIKKKKKFTNFLQSQIIWDETMAETISDYLIKNPKKKLVVLAGGGHVRFRFGIPSRVKRRTGLKGLVVLMDDQLKKDIADYIIYTAHLVGQVEKKLGVFVEESEKGLKVLEVKKNSPAEKSGIKKGDIIIGFNGIPIKNLIDLKVELFYSEDINNIMVLRNGKKIKLKVEFEQ